MTLFIHFRLIVSGLILASVFHMNTLRAAQPPQVSTAAPTSTLAPAAAVGPVTQAELLSVAKMVMDASKEHAERSRENLNWLMTAIGVAAALLAFFGYKEIKSIGAPYKEKLEALRIDYENKLNTQIAEFLERSHNNARALVATSRTWSLIEQVEDQKAPPSGEVRDLILRGIIDHVDKALPADYTQKLDPYLAGLLLIRKAFALKRLGHYLDAFRAAKAALDIDSGSPQAMWYYNTACYAALARQHVDCCDLLSQAIAMEPKNRVDAATETDFDSLKTTPEFIALLRDPV